MPRAVHQYFVTVQGREQVFAFDRETGEKFTVSIKDAAAERDFNRVVIGKAWNWKGDLAEDLAEEVNSDGFVSLGRA